MQIFGRKNLIALVLITTPCLLFLFCLDPCFDGIPWKLFLLLVCTLMSLSFDPCFDGIPWKQKLQIFIIL